MTTAVFFIRYLRTLGFDVTNGIFAENAWYFRNSLVRTNYNDLKMVFKELEKANIEYVFTAKTASHIHKLQGALGSEAAFGGSNVQRGVKPTRSSALL